MGNSPRSPCFSQFGVSKFAEMTITQRAAYLGLKRRVRSAAAASTVDIVAALNATAHVSVWLSVLANPPSGSGPARRLMAYLPAAGCL